MPRKPLVRTKLLPYHVTARANNREEFQSGPGRMWELLESECLAAGLTLGAEFHAVVLMPNHLHILLTVPEHDLGIVMNAFISNLAREYNKRTGRSGHLFGAPYHWSLVASTRYYRHVFKYVYRNPVRAGLSPTVEDYPYSSLHGLLGRAPLRFPVHLTKLGLEVGFPSLEPVELLDWLNRPFPKEVEALIQQGLRKRMFDELMDRTTRRTPEILLGLL
jgi:putative transposase